MKRALILPFLLACATLSSAAHADGPFGSGDAEQPASPPAPSPAPALSPAPAPDADAIAAPRAPEAPKPSSPVGFRADGGWASRKLLTLPVMGADIGAAFGAQPKQNAAFWGSGRLLLGSTDNGLRVWSARIGGEAEAVFDRLRIGAGLQLMFIGVGRATRDQTIISWGPACFGSARIDVVQSEGFALFARAALDLGYEVNSSSAFWGPTLGGGVDFDLAGNRAALK
jgi:hypothetical protein